MCLAVPMRISPWTAAVCEAKGIEREVSLFMMQGEEIAAGDHVLVARRLRDTESERGGRHA